MQSNSTPDLDPGTVDAPRILVVEDEFLIRLLVADHLRESGFIVLEAFNGEEAIAILKSGALVDLVFTDVRMPGAIDGLGLLDFIKQAAPDLPVIVTSGHLQPDLALAGGAVQFLPKPCDLDGITRVFHDVLCPVT